MSMFLIMVLTDAETDMNDLLVVEDDILKLEAKENFRSMEGAMNLYEKPIKNGDNIKEVRESYDTWGTLPLEFLFDQAHIEEKSDA